MSYVLTTCPFCGCGCGLYLQVEGGRVVGTVASANHPVSRGRLCAKGWHAHEVSVSSRRLVSPLIRRGDGLEEAGWEEALDLVAKRLGAIKEESGAAALGFLGSARATNEENYLLGKLARHCIGTSNVDFSLRLDALPGLFDLPKYRHLTIPAAGLEDIDRADLIVLWQTDPVEEHPAAAARVLAAREQGVPILEVAARSGQLGGRAALRLSPMPGTEVQLAAGLVRAALGGIEQTSAKAKTLAAVVNGWTPEKTESVTGVPGADVLESGCRLAVTKRPLIIYGRGATRAPQGPELLMVLAALGQAGAERAEAGAGLLWLTNYCNLMGARDVGMVPYFLPGYQDVGDEQARQRVARVWGAAPPAEAGFACWDMLGKVRGLYVMGDDPVSALPDGASARAAVAGLDFLVVQEAFLTPTAAAADVVLPAATFAEKEGTFTSTERRVQRVRRAVGPPGAARAELEVLCELAERLGRPMGYGSAAEVMEEIASVSPVHEGLSYGELEREWGVRWPRERAMSRGRAEIGAEERGEDPALMEETAAPRVDEEFPLVLSADYSLDAWSTDTLVESAVGLRRQKGADRRRAARVLMSGSDAERLGVRSGARVRLRSRSGVGEATVEVSAGVRPGVVIASASMLAGANGLARCSAEPETGVPRLQPCAIRIESI